MTRPSSGRIDIAIALFVIVLCLAVVGLFLTIPPDALITHLVYGQF